MMSAGGGQELLSQPVEKSHSQRARAESEFEGLRSVLRVFIVRVTWLETLRSQVIHTVLRCVVCHLLTYLFLNEWSNDNTSHQLRVVCFQPYSVLVLSDFDIEARLCTAKTIRRPLYRKYNTARSGGFRRRRPGGSRRTGWPFTDCHIQYR